MYCFFRPLDEGSEAKKTSISRALLTTPNRFRNKLENGWNSNGNDAICFTGMYEKTTFLYLYINDGGFLL